MEIIISAWNATTEKFEPVAMASDGSLLIKIVV